MDDLLSEFLTETTENLSVLDLELVRLEQNPNDPALLAVALRTAQDNLVSLQKLGEQLKSPKSCGNSPVGRDYEMGKQFDIRGTPAIVMNNGEMLGGYVSPVQLVEHLQGK